MGQSAPPAATTTPPKQPAPTTPIPIPTPNTPTPQVAQPSAQQHPQQMLASRQSKYSLILKTMSKNLSKRWAWMGPFQGHHHSLKKEFVV